MLFDISELITDSELMTESAFSLAHFPPDQSTEVKKDHHTNTLTLTHKHGGEHGEERFPVI